MSRDEDAQLPPELRAALGLEAADEDESTPDLEALWRLAGRAAPEEESLPEAEETWEGVRRHIEDDETSGEEAVSTASGPDDRRARAPSRTASPRRLWRWGAVATAVLLLGIGVWLWRQPVAVTAPPGTMATRTLPDGSTVELNAGTRLTFPRTFSTLSLLEDDRRLVRLQGEAYFEVESGTRPFVVQTPTARVEVVGTAFTVRSRRSEHNDTHVALAEGRLRVTSPTASDTGVVLRPGQAVTLSAGGSRTAVRDTSLDRVTAWRRGGFAVTDRSLPVLARELERRFNRSVRLDASIDADTRSNPLTLYYSRNAVLETILHDVCMARGLTYRATANGYILTRAKPK